MVQMQLKIHYFYNKQFSSEEQWSVRHERILATLQHLQTNSKISHYKIQDHQEAFPTEKDSQEFLHTIADFSIRHHVSLRQIFGSKKHGFWYLPSQFLLLYSSDQLVEVFPCRIGNTEIDILDFLDHFEKGEAWTTNSYRVRKKTKHEDLIDTVLKESDSLEAGLRFNGRSVQVSNESGERGIIDLVFWDKNDMYLLIEVKVKPDEFDKAIGQILRHQELFIKQNFLEKGRVRVGIACPCIPSQARKICGNVEIECFELKNFL